MKYIYPKFSKYDFFAVRFGGAGLGNLLFIYSRALMYAKKHNLKLIWPTWRSIKLGPWLRHEKDKRFYGDLFSNQFGYVDGLEKVYTCMMKDKCEFNIADANTMSWEDEKVYVFSMYDRHFADLIPYRELIKNDIWNNLKDNNKDVLMSLVRESKSTNVINVHVRLGDFEKPNKAKLNAGNDNISISIEWYVSTIKKINSIWKNQGKELPIINIFSDGTDEELRSILEINNTRRVFYGNSITDILALSLSKLIIGSGSTFSMWARFLGACSSISYPGQIKDFVLEYAENSTSFEIELAIDDPISVAENKIVELYGINLA